MSDALITVVLTQLASILEQQIRREFKLVFGVEKEVSKLKSSLESVRAVLVDAERRQVKEESVKIWVEKLRQASYDMDDVLSEWGTAILKVKIEALVAGGNGRNTDTRFPKMKVCLSVPFPCFCSDPRTVSRRDIAVKIKEITGTLDSIASDKDRYNFTAFGREEFPGNSSSSNYHKSTSYADASMVCGRDEDRSSLLRMLLSESSSQDSNNLQMIFIWGMGGVGKTTLAQLVYNCSEVTNHFEKRMWVCVSENFDEVRVAKAIFEGSEGSAVQCVEFQAVLDHVRDSVMGKKFLLVLDDVWTEEHPGWEPLVESLKGGARGSRVLVTTRKESVAKMVGATLTVQKTRHKFSLHLGILSDEECWSLFSRIAFSGRSSGECEDLKDIGKQISDKCKGLPLAAKTVGSLMLFKNTRRQWLEVLNTEIWELKGAESLFPPLLLSYNDVPSAIKRCFCYCASFPKDHKIEADTLIKLWMAQGYLSSIGSVTDMEITGREYLDNLVMRSFFQDLEKDKDDGTVLRFKMHDMVHDFARHLMKKESFIMGEADEKMDSTSWKGFRHLTIIRGDDATFPLPPDNSERLHTFWVQSFHDCPPIVSAVDKDSPSHNLFHRLKYLKALDLSRNRLSNLPSEVEKLMNLRFLNLSHNPLWELPETVCSLSNLQTLMLVSCDHLTKLPQRMERLVNLRHLELDGTSNLITLPQGIGKLSSLRTLSKFVISSTEAASCQLGDLRHLNQLRGCLTIEGLGCVEDAAEAKKAELHKKENLTDLRMDCSSTVPDEAANEVIEALQPNMNLLFLQLRSYEGSQFPGWMNSLTCLRRLRIQDCSICSSLPPLGKLPSLEILNIEKIHNLKSVGHEFLGELSSSASAFPKLKKLKFAHMRSWEEWDMVASDDEGNCKTVMPCLHYLKLSNCHKLKALPRPLVQLVPLKKLHIYTSPVLKQRYQKGGEDWNSISHISKVRIS